jgi:hypothetical protein
VSAVAACALVNVAAVMTMQTRLRLFDMRRELLAVPLYGAGILAGAFVAWLFG